MNHTCILLLQHIIAEYEETDYPMELVDVAFWRPFWWYDSTGGWPTNATDTLGGNVLDLLYSCIVKSKIVFEFQIFNIACERTIYIKYNDIYP